MNRMDRSKISPSIIHDIHKVLRCAFNQAVKWEYIAKNPFLNATLPEHKEKKRNANLSPDEVLYKEDRAFTDGVIGHRRRTKIDDKKDNK